MANFVIPIQPAGYFMVTPRSVGVEGEAESYLDKSPAEQQDIRQRVECALHYMITIEVDHGRKN